MMNSGKEQPWDDRHKPLYELALKPMTDEEGSAVVRWAALHEEWRPSPARLIQIAAEQSSAIPDAEAAYAEILDAAQRHGEYACPHPSNPNIRTLGPPEFSHPVVKQIVSYCGGWEFICSGDANKSEGLKKQVRGAHESVSRQWVEQVKTQLMLPPSQRNQKYFQAWKPLPILSSERPMIERLKVDPPQLVEMPAEIRKMIAGTAKALK